MRTTVAALALSVALVVPAVSAPAPAPPAQEDAGAGGFGAVHFPVTCAAGLQPAFDRAVAMLHSFAYPEAAAAFAELGARDSTCAMAWWGVAMCGFHQIWGPPTAAEFAAGRAAAARAEALAPRVTARERDYIGAIDAYYAGDGLEHAARVAAYDRAMAGVAQRNPADREARIFHALAILAVAYNSPPDKSYARQLGAAAILDSLWRLEPNHPGIAHYLIHAYDYPELAERALPAARAYSRIAPAAPHALHMPAHIFTRLGLWRESIASNRASARVAREWAAREHPGATPYDALHAMDYLEYAYLQTGQDDSAAAIVDSVHRAFAFDVPAFQAGYALAAIPARYALERRDWKGAAGLALGPASFPWNDYPYAEAILRFARALGAARSGDPVAARADVARLESIRDGLRGRKGFDWASQVEVQRRAAAGWLAHTERRDDEALALLRSAAALEDSTDKHPVTPGSVLPAREQLGDLLLELGRPREALVEYERSMRTSRARLNAYAGAARAAGRAGDAAKARAYGDSLRAQCNGRPPDRLAWR